MELNYGHTEGLLETLPGYIAEKAEQPPSMDTIHELLSAHLPDGKHQYQDFLVLAATLPFSAEVNEHHIIRCLALLEDERNRREEVFLFISGLLSAVYHEARTLLSMGIYLSFYEGNRADYLRSFGSVVPALHSVLDLLEGLYSDEFVSQLERNIELIESGNVVDIGEKPPGLASMPRLLHFVLAEELSWLELIKEQQEYLAEIEQVLVEGQPLSADEVSKGKAIAERITNVLTARPEQKHAALIQRTEQISE